jgi:hypothetical protein
MSRGHFARRLIAGVVVAGAVVLAGGAASAQDQTAAPAAAGDAGGDATAIAKKLQNPIGDLISVPFQSNTNFGFGPHGGTQEILNIQPVIPFHVGDNWNIITRTILPLVWMPSLQPAQSVPFGTAPITFSAFLSPRNPTNGWLWGVGPVVQIPIASDPVLGSSVWGLGATGVLVYMHGPWVAGVLVNNVWSLGGEPARAGRPSTQYNNFLAQPFVNYNLKAGWYVGTSPIITANWLASSGDMWTVPIGANVGRVIKLGKLPVNLSVGAYGNVVHPQFGPNWQLRSQVTFIF